MADDAAAAEAEAPPEEGGQRGKLALMSIRGLGLIALLLAAEGLAIMAVVKATGDLEGSDVKVETAYIPFDQVTANISAGAKRNMPLHYQLTPELKVTAADKKSLEQLIKIDLKPLFVDRVMALMEKIPPASGGRQMDTAKLRSYLKKEVQAIFNRELLKLEKYQKMFKKEINEFKEKMRDPRQKHLAIQPGPIKDVVFTKFSF